jgi:glycosyltransferase involved in cell wall biosynthesis
MVLGTFYNTNWFLSHARPLAASGVAEVLVVTDEATPELERVRFAGPPRWASAVLSRQVSKLLWAFAWALRRRPDLYMGFHIAPNALTALVLGRLFGRPTCYQMTGGPVELLGGGIDSENQLLTRLRKPSARLERLALRAASRFDLVVVRGESARRFLGERGVTARSAIIPGSVDLRRIAASEERGYDLIFVGRLTETKRPLEFLEIAAQVARSRPTLRALVVGEGPLLPDARRLAASLGLDGCLELVGRRSDVAKLLARSRVFVLTSRSEGLSIAMAEAMCAGVVPVVSDVGELAELVRDGENGYLVAAGDRAGFVARILGLLQDAALWRRLSLAAADTAHTRVGLARISELWAGALRDTIGGLADGGGGGSWRTERL